MGEKLPDPLNVVRAKLVSPCEEERRNSWASGCPPHLLALPVDILFLLNKSQRAQVLLWKSKILQDAAFPVPRHSFKYIPMKWHIAGLCLSPGELGMVRGNARITELLPLPWAKPSLWSLGLTARLPLEFPPCF